MLHPEIEHRDKVLRAYFVGRNWDQNNEFTLKRKLVTKCTELLPDYPYVVEEEWEVEPGHTDQGRGDLVFTDGKGNFAVVEVKWIDQQGEGRKGDTKRKSNTNKRRKVEDQAVKYRDIYAELARDRWGVVRQVDAFFFTNEYEQPSLLIT